MAAVQQKSRIAYQAFIWRNDIIANVLLPNVCDFGWSLADEGYTPKFTDLPQLQMQGFSWSSVHASIPQLYMSMKWTFMYRVV